MATTAAKLTNCPHCTRSTSVADGFCAHCREFLDMDSVLLAESCRVTTAVVAAAGPVILMHFGCRGNTNKSELTTIAVKTSDVSALRNALLDGVLAVGPSKENGEHEHDSGRTSTNG